MTCSQLINALQKLKVQTNSITCLGCGHEHNCSVHGVSPSRLRELAEEERSKNMQEVE